MAPTQTIDYPCPTCSSPMALVRVSPLDRQYDVRFLKCEICKCEVCSHMDKSQGETVKNQVETEMKSAAIERPRRDEGSERTYNWVRATAVAVRVPHRLGMVIQSRCSKQSERRFLPNNREALLAP